MAERLSPLIRPEDLSGIIHDPNLIVVDARGGSDARARFERGHLAGAAMANLEMDLSDIGPDAAKGGRHPLPDVTAFAALLGKLGITPSTHVLVYDDKSGANAAARFWWMLKAAGHQRVQVIDGGLDGIRGAGLPVVGGPAASRHEEPPYPVTHWELPLADMAMIDQMRTDKTSLVIDARERYRYSGKGEPIDLVAGHIPGAVNIPYVDNLDDRGRFRSPDELASMYKSILEDKSADLVAVHCGSGVTACHLLLAMDVARLPLPKLYVGSWSEWSRNDKPIATGDSP